MSSRIQCLYHNILRIQHITFKCHCANFCDSMGWEHAILSDISLTMAYMCTSWIFIKFKWVDVHTSELRNGRWRKRWTEKTISGTRMRNIILTILWEFYNLNILKSVFRRTSNISIEGAKDVLYRVLNYICNTLVEDIIFFLFK